MVWLTLAFKKIRGKKAPVGLGCFARWTGSCSSAASPEGWALELPVLSDLQGV